MRNPPFLFGNRTTCPRKYEACPLISQCERCWALGHDSSQCPRPKDTVVCPIYAGAHKKDEHHKKCQAVSKHTEVYCTCPIVCINCCQARKLVKGHSALSLSCLLCSKFRSPNHRPCIVTMIDTPISIVSVNMRRRNPLLIAFLQATSADIVMIQEPWFGRLIPSHSDSNPDGKEVCGFAAHPGWEIFTLKHQKGDICKVMTYVQQSLLMSHNVCVVSLVDHHVASLSSQALEVTISGAAFILVNIYHHIVNHCPALGHILCTPLDSVLPTYVVGDFNTHSSTWSFLGTTVSSWASPLEDWFEDSDLLLVNPTGLATCRGEAQQHDSIIDLALLNDSALCSGRFSHVSVSFLDSLGSDHAALSIDWSPPFKPLPYVPALLPGFVIDDSLVASWTKDFASLPTPLISDIASLSRAADALDTDIYAVSGKLFKCCHTPDFRGLHWWNIHCEAALTAIISI